LNFDDFQVKAISHLRSVFTTTNTIFVGICFFFCWYLRYYSQDFYSLL